MDAHGLFDPFRRVWPAPRSVPHCCPTARPLVNPNVINLDDCDHLPLDTLHPLKNVTTSTAGQIASGTSCTSHCNAAKTGFRPFDGCTRPVSASSPRSFSPIVGPGDLPRPAAVRGEAQDECGDVEEKEEEVQWCVTAGASSRSVTGSSHGSLSLDLYRLVDPHGVSALCPASTGESRSYRPRSCPKS